MRTVVAGLVLLGVLAAPAAAHDVDVDVVSSRADQVSGGDALVRIEARRRHDLRVFRNGAEVTDAFEREGRDLVGLVDGLRLGRNRITVYDGRRRVAKQHLENHPIEGPIFSGPHQRPFVCKTIQAGLGEPLVDNQAGDGFRVLAADGTTAGWSRDCGATTRVDWLYRRASGGDLMPLPPGPLPADVATTTTLDGKTVPFIVRRERGTINRFIYSLAMLADPTAPETDTSRWNRRLVYFFDGGVAIGRNQGTPGGSALNPDLLGSRLRDRALERDARERPLQHGPRRRDRADDQGALRRALRRAAATRSASAAPAARSSSTCTARTTTACSTARSRRTRTPTWSPRPSTSATASCSSATWTSPTRATRSGRTGRTASGSRASTASATFPNPLHAGAAGSSECVNGWRGLTPLAMNPLFGTAGAGTERMDPAVMAAVHWTHWEDVRNVYGVGPDGYARQTWDNVGVQYGLKALTDGNITPAEFLHAQRHRRLVEGPGRDGPGGPAVPARRTPTRGASATSATGATRRRAAPARSPR